MKSLFRVLKATLPKSVLVYSLTTSFKAIKLDDKHLQFNNEKIPIQHPQHIQTENQNILLSQDEINKKNKQNQKQKKQQEQNEQKQKQLNKADKNSLQPLSSSQIDNAKSQRQNQQKKQKELIRQNMAILRKDTSKNIIQYLTKRQIKIQFSEDLENQTIFLYNSKKQQKLIRLNQDQTKRDFLFTISNFLAPTKQVLNIQEAKILLSQIQKDQSIISVYIPCKEEYDEEFQQKLRSKFDSFTKSFYLDIQKMQNQFNIQKQFSSTKKNQYVIVRSKQAAQYLKVNVNKIGIPHILYNSYQLTGNEPNCKIQDKNYTCHNLERFAKSVNFQPQKMAIKINEITNQYISCINVKQDLIDKIRQIKQFNAINNLEKKTKVNKKLLIVKVDEEKHQFQKNIDKVLEKVARILKNQVVIVKTQNQQMLKEVLHIFPDNYATIRLIDLEKQMKPILPAILSSKRQQNVSFQYPFFTRYIMKGPFQVQNICQFINNCELSEPYYEKKEKLTNLKAIYPWDYNKLVNSVILFQKYGCNGCNLAENLLEKVMKLQNLMKHKNVKLSKQISFKYKIQRPELFTNLNIKKYNILNQDSQNFSPQTTPKLILYKDPFKKFDLKIDQIFNLLKNIQKGHSEEAIHDKMVEQIIQRMTKKQTEE